MRVWRALQLVRRANMHFCDFREIKIYSRRVNAVVERFEMDASIHHVLDNAME